ncbi:hypothetical protein D3C81_1390060 [compost metagenome]
MIIQNFLDYALRAAYKDWAVLHVVFQVTEWTDVMGRGWSGRCEIIIRPEPLNCLFLGLGQIDAAPGAGPDDRFPGIMPIVGKTFAIVFDQGFVFLLAMDRIGGIERFAILRGKLGR